MVEIRLISVTRHACSGLMRLCLASCLIAVPALAQGPTRSGAEVYPDSSHTADGQIRNAAQHANAQQWAEAVEIYQKVIEKYGDKVTKLPKDDPTADKTGVSDLYVDVRQCCQRRLAALPPAARALYRSRVDAQAERWYRQGAADRDRGMLRRVIEEAFCSSWGDDALDLLGDLAFQDGRFAEALSAYRQLVPDHPGDPLGLTHPDPTVDLARVAAKKLLCRAALGDDPPGPADIQAFAADYPNASGSFAGRNGPLHKGVADALSEDRLAPPATLDGRWPTFAGAPTRTRIASGSIDVGSFQWKVPLELQMTTTLAIRGFRGGRGRPPFAPEPSNGHPEQQLAYHPIVLGDQVIVCDEKQVVAYNLNDRPDNKHGSQVDVAWRHEHQPLSTPTATRGYVGQPRYTLTAYGDRVYARLGPPGAPMPRNLGGGPGSGSSVIVALDRATDGKLLWKRSSTEITLPQQGPDGPSAGFEGSPVADAHNVYIALTISGIQTGTYVACLDADTGATRWVRFICQAPSTNENGAGMPFLVDLSHRLLTLDGSTIYYQTNLGAVAALDAESGRLRWLASYPRPERNFVASPRLRDLNPAIFHSGLVIVAPDDNPRIFAFDAVSGRLVWQTAEPLDVTHLLGVARGKLVASGDHVWTIDVRSGKVLRRWPDNPQGFEGFGRGLLAGNHIYWPTKSEIHVLDQETGLRTDRPPIKLQEMFQTGGGNLAVGDGYLIVAQADALVVFCQNSRLIERYHDEIAHAPDQASHYFRLAQAAEATDQDELALKSLGQAITRAKTSETVDGQPLLETARAHQFRLLMKLASRAGGSQDWKTAILRYEEAARAAGSDRDRLMARIRLADAHVTCNDDQAAVDTLQGLLADDRIRLLSVSLDAQRTVRADLVIADRLGGLVRKHDGRLLYTAYDREADRLLERGREEQDPRLLEEVGRSFPVAKAVPASLLALGRLHQERQRPADAAHAYKRLLALTPSDAERARALWGLAQAYESQRLWVPARDTYLLAQSRSADQRVDGPTGEVTLGAVVAARLEREPFPRMADDMNEPAVTFPLARRWDQHWSGKVRPLAADGVPPSSRAGRVFLADGHTLRLVDPISGKEPWSANLGGDPTWVGYLADRVLAATAQRLVSLDIAKGTITWQSDLARPRPVLGRVIPNPFAKSEPAEPRPAIPAGRLHDFRIVGNRVFCQRGDRELLAVDGDTGLVDWSFAPAVGQINPLLWIGPSRIVLQVRKPHAILVLDTTTGRSRAEYPQSDEEDWARDPFPIDDDRVALVVDRRTVALFDLNRGRATWTFRESPAMPRNGPPRLLGHADRLLVLYDGDELIRLDPTSGGRLWARKLGPEDLSERVEAMAVDGDRFYWAGPGQNLDRNKTPAQLQAISLADGKVVWTRYLTGPERGWALTLAERCVAAYPIPCPPDQGSLTDLPLVFCRRDTGGLVQRLLFQANVSDLAVRLAPRVALIATQDGLWALGDRPPLDEAAAP